MKVPTDATKVFAVANQSHSGAPTTITSGFPVDLLWNRASNAVDDWYVIDRLRGNSPFLLTNSTAGEDTSGTYYSLTSNTTVTDNNHGGTNPLANYMFRRAPNYFDMVCYTGDGLTTRQVTHNLTVAPELIIVKRRNGTSSWEVRYPSVANNRDMLLNLTNSQSTLAFTPADTSTTFTVSTQGSEATNDPSRTYVAYLFATCPGVSKVGSYTGNGSTQTIDCGLTGGARFVLIKRTDSTGDWYVYDTARGMTVLTDPYLRLNSTAAEVATLGSVTTVSTGFALNAAVLAAINASGGSYIFLAIA
jgi:hypothetical protein